MMLGPGLTRNHCKLILLSVHDRIMEEKRCVTDVTKKGHDKNHVNFRLKLSSNCQDYEAVAYVLDGWGLTIYETDAKPFLTLVYFYQITLEQRDGRYRDGRYEMNACF